MAPTSSAPDTPDVATSLSELTGREPFDALLSHRVDFGLTREDNTDDRIASELLFSEPLALVGPDLHWIMPGIFSGLERCRHEPFSLCSLNASLNRAAASVYSASRPDRFVQHLAKKRPQPGAA